MKAKEGETAHGQFALLSDFQDAFNARDLGYRVDEIAEHVYICVHATTLTAFAYVGGVPCFHDDFFGICVPQKIPNHIKP